jgi:hypothetical protein
MAHKDWSYTVQIANSISVVTLYKKPARAHRDRKGQPMPRAFMQPGIRKASAPKTLSRHAKVLVWFLPTFKAVELLATLH